MHFQAILHLYFIFFPPRDSISTVQIYKMTQTNNYKNKQKSSTRRAFICKTLFNTRNSVTWSKCGRCIGKGAGTKQI